MLGTWRKLIRVSVISAVSSVIASGQPESSDAFQWPQWRGPHGNGAAHPDAAPPIVWSETENVAWKTAIPGLGHSTPVVSNGIIHLTTAVPKGTPLPEPIWSNRPGAHDNLPISDAVRSLVVAVDFKSGDILWSTQVDTGVPHEGGHETGSLASASPSTDGKSVFAYFGSRGLFALDRTGQILWSKQLGKMHSKHGHGEASSPVLHDDLIVVNWDHEESEDFLVAFDKTTGLERWRTPREEVTSWTSPIAAVVDETAQIIVSGTTAIRGYDLRTGKVIWSCPGLSKNVVATPVYSQELGMLFAGSSYEKQAFLAIKIGGAKGDLSATDRVAWTRFRRTPYVPSPLVYQGGLYYFGHYQNILTRVTAENGTNAPGAMRVEALRNSYASPIGASGRIYLCDLSGNTVILAAGDKPEVLQHNQLDGRFAASPVAVGSSLILRSDTHLYRLEEAKSAE